MNKIRVYFNRWSEQPLIWSVDHGSLDTEQKVKNVVVHDVHGRTNTDETVPAGDMMNPRVWLEYQSARLEIHGDVAMIYGNAMAHGGVIPWQK